MWFCLLELCGVIFSSPSLYTCTVGLELIANIFHLSMGNEDPLHEQLFCYKRIAVVLSNLLSVLRWLVLNKKRAILLNLSFYLWNTHRYNLIQSLMGLVMYKGAGQKPFLFINDSCCCMTFASLLFLFIGMILILLYMNFIIIIFFSYHKQWQGM